MTTGIGRQQDRSESRASSVRALKRGLEILRHVNAVGEARPGEIARALDIPRPTVYRLLQTLEEEGYVALSASSPVVRVTPQAAALGDGSARISRLCQAAGPLFAEYGRKLVWPLDLSVYENAAMVIQETTHGRSPLSIDRGMTGYRLPMLRTSAGRCYLGHCHETERALILSHLRRLNLAEDAPFLDPRYLEPMLAEVARSGLGTRETEEFRPQTASFAVPVMQGGRVRACVSMIWIRSAMSLREALEGNAEALRELAARLGAALSQAG